MQTFIIAVLSADGFIARSDLELSTKWTSKEDTQYFVERTKQAGVVIMGSKTFETFGAKPLKDRRTIIYSRKKQYADVESTKEDPKELIKRLEQEGVSEIAIAGGASIYTLFLKAGVVDKLLLSVEGVLFGKGISLLNQSLDLKMKLLSQTQIGPSTVLLEYDIIKN